MFTLNTNKIISIVLTIALISICYGEIEMVPAGVACAFSVHYKVPIFNAPIDGTLIGIKAMYIPEQSEPMTCDYGCSNARAKWGCPHCNSGERKFMIEFMKVTDATNYAGFPIYPTFNTPGFRSGGSIYCDRGCKNAIYFLDGQDIDDDIITMTGDTYEVTTDDQFMMQIPEGCCGSTIHDNTGHVCAEIVFIYNNTVTPGPTIEPTEEPSLSPIESGQTACEWKLVYEHNDDGTTISGNIDILVDDVYNGKDVRVVFHSGWIFTQPRQVYVYGGEVYVYQSGTPNLPNGPSPGFTSSVTYEQFFDTSGRRQIWLKGGSGLYGTDHNGAKWYTRG